MDERAVKPGVLSFANSPSTRLCKTDANQDEAGGKELRDRMIAGRYVPGCGKSKILGDSRLRALPHVAAAAGRRIDQTATSS